ncbi:hypothetical protein Q1695_011249 [Nippostrongylus brasiliensis]|nr:hypothetical protein Q1695_011249 [Nippostrongylus brasiliensis]
MFAEQKPRIPFQKLQWISCLSEEKVADPSTVIDFLSENFACVESGRRGVIACGWRRCSSNRVGTTDNDDFYTTDLLAKAVSLTFVKLPEFIHRLYVSSDHMSENLEGKKIKVKATDRRVEMYLPNALRVDIDSL